MKKMAFLLSLLTVGSRFQRGNTLAASRRISTCTLQRSSDKGSGGKQRSITRSVARSGRRRPHPLYTVVLASSAAVVGGFSSLTSCSTEDETGVEIQVPPFDESSLTYDHYNGVTLHLDKILEFYKPSQDAPINQIDASSFGDHLKQAIDFWKAEGRRGIWIQAPPEAAHLVPVSRNGDKMPSAVSNIEFVLVHALVLSSCILTTRTFDFVAFPTVLC